MSESTETRRGFLASAVMWSALAVAHGVAAVFGFRFLRPAPDAPRFRQVFVTTLDRLPEGASMLWSAPDGSKIVVNNLAGQIIALSITCPHLGCKVSWTARESQFVCPCHDGRFDKNGAPISGPPKAENKSLRRYEAVVQGNAIYVRVPEA